jgi:hypothetical protein
MALWQRPSSPALLSNVNPDTSGLLTRDCSQRQYKRRIKDWNLNKNLKKSEMKAMVRKVQARKELGKHTTFRVRGREVDVAKISRWIKYSAKQEASSRSHESPAPSKTMMRLLKSAF